MLAKGGDLPALAREAHDLKSVSATTGAAQLRDCAAALERAAKANDPDAVRAALPALQQVAGQTWPLIEGELAAAGS